MDSAIRSPASRWPSSFQCPPQGMAFSNPYRQTWLRMEWSPDGDALTFSSLSLPPGLSLNTTTGLISGSSTFEAAGTYSVMVSATDGSLSRDRWFTWTVAGAEGRLTARRSPSRAPLGVLHDAHTRTFCQNAA